MTTLMQRHQALTAKFEQLSLAQRHVNQQRQVRERTREWKSCYEKLKGVAERTSFLTLDDKARGCVFEKRAQLRHNASEVLGRLRSHEDIAQLTRDASWTRLLASVESLAQELRSAGIAAWRSYIDEQGALEDPTWLRDRAPSTPLNNAAIAAYQTQYGAYADLVKNPLPRSASDLTRLPQVIAVCREEAAKITFDVPQDVQKFFQAIQSGIATLASLTPGVLKWLAENGQLERYRIRSAAQ